MWPLCLSPVLARADFQVPQDCTVTRAPMICLGVILCISPCVRVTWGGPGLAPNGLCSLCCPEQGLILLPHYQHCVCG